MGKAIPSQHPAVVLRSHFRQVRALLAIALIAVVGLTVAVVILANDGDEVASTSSAKPIESLNYGGFNPATGRPESAPLPQQEQPLQTGSRYDGGPEEGTSSARQQDLRHLRAGGDIAAQPKVTQQQAFPGLADKATGTQTDGRRYDTHPPTARYDGGPEEGTTGPTPCCGMRP